MAKIIGIDHMTFGVRDLEQRMTTFKRVFGAAPLFKLEQGSHMEISFELGGKIINLISKPEDGGREGLDHIGLAVDDLKGLKAKKPSEMTSISKKAAFRLLFKSSIGKTIDRLPLKTGYQL